MDYFLIREKEDEEAARKLAEELEKEELRNAHCALQNDMHIAKSFQVFIDFKISLRVKVINLTILNRKWI